MKKKNFLKSILKKSIELENSKDPFENLIILDELDKIYNSHISYLNLKNFKQADINSNTDFNKEVSKEISDIEIIVHTGNPIKILNCSPTTFYYPERYLLHPKNQVEWIEDVLRDIYSHKNFNNPMFQDNKCFIVTNSDSIIHRLRVAKKRDEIENIKFLFYSFDNNNLYEPPITIKIDKKGTLSENPKGLVDEIDNQLLELLTF